MVSHMLGDCYRFAHHRSGICVNILVDFAAYIIGWPVLCMELDNHLADPERYHMLDFGS